MSIDPLDHIDAPPTDEEIRQHKAQTRRHVETVQSMMTVIAIKLAGEGRLLGLRGQADELLTTLIGEMNKRSEVHDDSKFETPELEIFARVSPQLKGIEYGSDEYDESLQKLGPALNHHYQANDHHPEHYEDGIADMTFPALLEMCADWVASSGRGKDGSIFRSVHVNQSEYGMPLSFSMRALGTMYRLKQEEGNPGRLAEVDPGSFIGLAARFCSLYGPDAEKRRRQLAEQWTLSPMLLAVFENTAESLSLSSPFG